LNQELQFMGEAHLPNRGRAKAQFTAALLLEKQVKLSFSQLEAELKRIAPRAMLGGWGGPVTNPAVDPGMGMLNLNGENLSVLVIDAPAPAAVLKPGPFANSLWPNAETDAAHHTAHIVIIGLQDTIDREAALKKARAVTLLAAAIVRLVPAIGVTWVDGANLVRASAFPVMTKNIGQPDANAVPFWVRIMLAKGPPGARGEQTMKAGTLGLRIFGLRELEYAPVPLDPGFILQHAYSVSEYLLRSGKRLADGETIGVGGQAVVKEVFTISHAEAGNFASYPIARLSLQTNK
jgi:hypothetical protein